MRNRILFMSLKYIFTSLEDYSRGTEGTAVPTSYVHSVHDFCRDSVKLMQASLTLTAPNYVLSDHDFLHDSAKLMQAFLALAAPKIQMRYARSK